MEHRSLSFRLRNRVHCCESALSAASSFYRDFRYVNVELRPRRATHGRGRATKPRGGTEPLDDSRSRTPSVQGLSPVNYLINEQRYRDDHELERAAILSGRNWSTRGAIYRAFDRNRTIVEKCRTLGEKVFLAIPSRGMKLFQRSIIVCNLYKNKRKIQFVYEVIICREIEFICSR